MAVITDQSSFRCDATNPKPWSVKCSTEEPRHTLELNFGLELSNSGVVLQKKRPGGTIAQNLAGLVAAELPTAGRVLVRSDVKAIYQTCDCVPRQLGVVFERAWL